MYIVQGAYKLLFGNSFLVICSLNLASVAELYIDFVWEL